MCWTDRGNFFRERSVLRPQYSFDYPVDIISPSKLLCLKKKRLANDDHLEELSQLQHKVCMCSFIIRVTAHSESVGVTFQT